MADDERSATERTLVALTHLQEAAPGHRITLPNRDLFRMLQRALEDGAENDGARPTMFLVEPEPTPDQQRLRARIDDVVGQAIRARDDALEAFLVMWSSGAYAAAFTWGPEGIRADQAARTLVAQREALGQASGHASSVPQGGIPGVPGTTCGAAVATTPKAGHGGPSHPHVCAKAAGHLERPGVQEHRCGGCGHTWSEAG